MISQDFLLSITDKDYTKTCPYCGNTYSGTMGAVCDWQNGFKRWMCLSCGVKEERGATLTPLWEVPWHKLSPSTTPSLL